MDVASIKPTTYIVPTQHVMQKAYTLLQNRYIPFDTFILLYLKFHRDVLNQPGSYVALDLFEEFEDDLEQAIIRFNKDRPFVELLDSNHHPELILGWDTIRMISKELFDKLKQVEVLLGNELASALPDAFYGYKCEPVWVRLYAGDLVVHLRPARSIAMQYT